MLKLSVGIVTKNRQVSLKETLDSLVRQSRVPDEVLVVEDDIQKKLDPLISGYKNKLKIKYLLGQERGIAFCRNVVLQKALGQIVIFVDDDCVVDEKWLKNILESFLGDKNIVGLIGRALNIYPMNVIGGLEQEVYEAWFMQYLPINKPCYVNSGMFVNTRNFAIRKSVVDKYRLRFNTKAPFKLEDTDFGINLYSKLSTKKEKIIYNPDVLIYHKNSTNPLQFLKRYLIAKKGEKWLLEKYPNFKNIPKRDKKVYQRLMRKNFLASVLFNTEGFVNRQQRRLNYLVETGHILWDVKEGDVYKR